MTQRDRFRVLVVEGAMSDVTKEQTTMAGVGMGGVAISGHGSFIPEVASWGVGSGTATSLLFYLVVRTKNL